MVRVSVSASSDFSNARRLTESTCPLAPKADGDLKAHPEARHFTVV